MSKNSHNSQTGAFKKVRIRVLQRDGYVCVYCGAEATQVDHRVPLASGGAPLDLDNLQAICKPCNLRKGSRSEAFFLRQTSTPPSSILLSPHGVTLSQTPKSPIYEGVNPN